MITLEHILSYSEPKESCGMGLDALDLSSLGGTAQLTEVARTGKPHDLWHILKVSCFLLLGPTGKFSTVKKPASRLHGHWPCDWQSWPAWNSLNYLNKCENFPHFNFSQGYDWNRKHNKKFVSMNIGKWSCPWKNTSTAKSDCVRPLKFRWAAASHAAEDRLVPCMWGFIKLVPTSQFEAFWLMGCHAFAMAVIRDGHDVHCFLVNRCSHRFHFQVSSSYVLRAAHWNCLELSEKDRESTSSMERRLGKMPSFF